MAVCARRREASLEEVGMATTASTTVCFIAADMVPCRSSVFSYSAIAGGSFERFMTGSMATCVPVGTLAEGWRPK